MSFPAAAAHALSKPLGAALALRGAKVASCESCTAGAVADAISHEAGASAWFEVGLVCYSEAAKASLAGVDPALIASHGVVSAEVAEAMARGAARVAGCRYGVATTGLAGPGDGEGPGGRLPQGLVCFCAWDAKTGSALREIVACAGDRAQVRAQAALCAMRLLLRAVESSV